MKKRFIEGPKAKEQFNRTMAALFRVKKEKLAQTIKKKEKKGKD